MTEILEGAAADLLPILADLLIALLGLLIFRGAQYFRQRTDSELAQYAAGALDRLDGVVRDAVGATVLQEQASLALADGRLSKEEALALAETARDEVRALLGPKGIEALAKVLDRDALELVIASKVKAAVEARFGSGGMLLEAVVEDAK